MLFMVFGSILTAHIQASVSEEEKNDPNGTEPVSHPEIYSPTTEVHIGENVTLSCFSKTGSLPIKYTLYKERNRVLPPVNMSNNGEKAEFHFTINLISDLGEYKCKAENNSTQGKYSLGFNFTMTAGDNHNLAVFIVPPVLLLLLLLALVLAVPLLILPWCKARKLRGTSPNDFVPARDPTLQNDVTYVEIAHEENHQEEYVNLEFSNKKEESKQVTACDYK
uniref:Uncharacterized protein n=1 Tax=Sphaerodactylus townsendi TaxID=933632 RepID=A0ACB8EL65_9SAUR